MNANFAFYTGKTHAICQDYARAKLGDFPYIIIGDGCSGSLETDTGARLLVLAAEKALKLNPSGMVNGEFFNHTVSAARVLADGCNLPPECLDVTILVAAYCPSNFDPNHPVNVSYPPEELEQAMKPMLRVTVYGDGVVAYKRKDTQEIFVHQTEYPSGFPSYCNYILNKNRAQLWYKEQEKHSPQVIRRTILCDKDWKIQKEVVNGEGEQSYGFFGSIERQFIITGTDVVEWVALMSDGVLTFAEKSKEPGVANRSIPLVEVLKDLLDFRNFNGVFVQRQADWFMKEAAKRGWQHNDDVSLAAIYMG